MSLLAYEGVDHRCGNGEAAHDIVVQDDSTAAGDRAQRQLFVTRNTKLAHEVDIQRHAELARDFCSHRHPAAWQGQHQDVVPAGVCRQLRGQSAPRICAIAE